MYRTYLRHQYLSYELLGCVKRSRRVRRSYWVDAITFLNRDVRDRTLTSASCLGFCTVSLDVSYVDKRKTGPCGVATFAINAGIDPVLNVLG